MTFEDILAALCGPRGRGDWIRWNERKATLTKAKAEWEKEQRERCFEDICDKCQPELEYGPHGFSANWYREDQIESAVMNAMPEEDE